MSRRNVEIMLPIVPDRALPPAGIAQIAQAIKASGAVDYFHIWDQLANFWPPGMWNPQNAPRATVRSDLDSHSDAVAVAAYAAAAAPGVGLTISTDAIRRGPAEMMQTMLTLANMGEGRAVLQLGAGEIKQCAPFGWKRNEGLRRGEDHFRFYDAFWKTDGAVTMNGNFWNFDRAWIGAARQHRPKMWALGGGPKLVDLATRYADGFATMVPSVFPTPERFADFVRNTRRAVAGNGRDPERFDFCPWFWVVIHDDPAFIERAFQNPLLRWLAAFSGRFNNHDWAEYGVEPAFDADWHYAMHLVPNRIDNQGEVDRILARVTDRMCKLSVLSGNAREVAAQMQPYIDAGANVIEFIDLTPLVLDADSLPGALARQLDVCARIKEMNARR